MYHTEHREPFFVPVPFFSQCSVTVELGDINNLFFLQHFWDDSTSLNLSPLFDHAVIVQKSPGRFLCVGRDHSYQEAEQVISIISLITHSGQIHCVDLPKPECNFLRARLPNKDQPNESEMRVAAGLYNMK